MNSSLDSNSIPNRGNFNRLASLMDSEFDHTPNWRPDELGAIFHHQLAAPVQIDLGGLTESLRPKIRELCLAEGLLLKSFRDLFNHPYPPVELLKLVKDYAKANRHLPDSSLPREVATALYYLSIAVALTRAHARISKVSDTELVRAFTRLGNLPWLDKEMQTVLGQALALLSEGKPPESTGA